jgi:GNAT superfamily N-acetyltransferase
MGTGWVVRELDDRSDRAAIADLWQAALAPAWPLLPRGLNLFRSGFVAAETGGAGWAGGLVGAAAVDPAGSVPVLLVAPDHQRQGIGTALLARVEQHLRHLGVAEVRAGSGGAGYIWPGVPEDLPAAAPFFAARGWRLEDRTIDLTRDLVDYRPPADVYDGVRRASVVIETATDHDRDAVLAFEAATFPSWLPAFRYGNEDVLLARDAEGRIVGTLQYVGPDENLILHPMLGPRCGAIGCVGVAPAAQGMGVGSAMVARASELLRDRGTRTCHIGWVVREAFYTRVGYLPWRSYLMYRKALP